MIPLDIKDQFFWKRNVVALCDGPYDWWNCTVSPLKKLCGHWIKGELRVDGSTRTSHSSLVVINIEGYMFNTSKDGGYTLFRGGANLEEMELCQMDLTSFIAMDQTPYSDLIAFDSHIIPEGIPEEPVRLLHPGKSQKPKRFYRTFWRCMARSIIASERQQCEMHAGILVLHY